MLLCGSIGGRQRPGKRLRPNNLSFLPHVFIAAALTMWVYLCCLPRVTTSVAVSTETVQQIPLVVEVGDIVDIAEECFDLRHNAVGMERCTPGGRRLELSVGCCRGQ